VPTHSPSRVASAQGRSPDRCGLRLRRLKQRPGRGIGRIAGIDDEPGAHVIAGGCHVERRREDRAHSVVAELISEGALGIAVLSERNVCLAVQKSIGGLPERHELRMKLIHVGVHASERNPAGVRRKATPFNLGETCFPPANFDLERASGPGAALQLS
jgi:hypothetical protein